MKLNEINIVSLFYALSGIILIKGRNRQKLHLYEYDILEIENDFRMKNNHF